MINIQKIMNGSGSNLSDKAVSFIMNHLYPLINIGKDYVDEIGVSYPIPKFDENVINDLLDKALFTFSKNTPLISVSQPVYVVGDIHGNFHDLMKIFNMVSDPFSHVFVFLGDYVDRGNFQLEVIITLLTLALQYPNNIILLRGNHEFKDTNRKGGFYDEVRLDYSENLYEKFNNVFAYLPLAAVIGTHILCVHGGIGPKFKKLENLRKIQFPYNTFGDDYIVEDLVWSDPTPQIIEFDKNLRGRGVVFGFSPLKRFLDKNSLKMMIRGHESISTGIKVNMNNTCYTVFSAAGYSNSNYPGGYIYIDNNDIIHSYKYEPSIVPKREEINFFHPKLDLTKNVKSYHSFHDLSKSLGSPILRPQGRRRICSSRERDRMAHRSYHQTSQSFDLLPSLIMPSNDL